MAGLNFGGCEEQDLSGFSATSGTCSADSSIKRSGSHSFRSNPSGAAVGYGNFQGYASTGLFGAFNVATLYMRAYLYVATRPTTNPEEIGVFVDSTPNDKLSIRLKSDGKLALYDSAGSLLGTSTNAVPLSTWTRIDLKCGTGASAAYELKIAGTVEITGTGNVGTNNNASFRFGKATNRNSETIDIYWDDWFFEDSAYPNDGKCVVLKPVSDGTYTNFTANGAANKWDCVDELPIDSNTTYLISTLTNDAYSANVETGSSKALSGTVNAVKAQGYFSRTGASVTALVRLRSGTTNSDSSAGTPQITTYTQRGKFANTDPNTGSAWALAALDSLQAGVVCNAQGVGGVRCTALQVMVDYAPAVAVNAVPRPPIIARLPIPASLQ